MRPFAALVPLVFVAALLAGCAGPDPPADPVTLVEGSHRTGERLFTNSWTPYAMDIQALLTVTDGTAQVGVRATGILGDEAAALGVFLADPEGTTRLSLQAANGLRDDSGTIDGFFTISGTAAAWSGNWTLRLDGEGYLETLGIEVQAVPAGPTSVEEPFQAARDGRLALTIDVAGFGAAPALRLERADGAVVATFPIETARSDLETEVALTAGAYRLVADTTGFGGRVSWQGILD